MTRDAEGATTDLIQRARAGDRRAFEQLVAEYEKRVWALAYRMSGNADDAYEIAQEVFLRVHQYLGSYDSRRSFFSWIYRITVNCTRDLVRQRPSHVALDDPEVHHEPEASGEDPGDRLDARAMGDRLRRLVATRLTPQERTVFLLRDVEGLSTREIAYVLGCTRITVRRHSAAARLKLRDALSRSHPELRTGGDEEGK